MIDVYPRYAELLAQRGGSRRRGRRAPRGASRPTTCATCRSGTSWPGSTRSTSTRDARVRRWSRKGRGFTEDDKAVLRDGRARAPERGHPGVPRRARRAGRSRCRRRRSTTRFCRCCATPTSTCGRIPDRAMPRQRVPASGGRRRAARAGRRRATSGCSAAGRSASGRRKGRSPTRWCRWSRAAGFTWMATDEQILARTLGIDVHARRPRPRRAARAPVRAVRVRAGGAQVACVFRDHALSDLIGFTYAGWDAGRGGRRLRRAAGRGRPALSRAHRRGRGDHPDHPRRRERLGALRGRRPAVPARAVSAAVRPPRAADGDDGRGVRGAAARR